MTVQFSSLDEFRDVLAASKGPNEAAANEAAQRNGQLTKPPGALGRLEDIAQWYASWRDDPKPRIENPQIVIFAGNHGVTAQGISAFPAEVTFQMVMNFRTGGAAINQLAKEAGATLDVHDLDLETPTNDFTTGPAMSDEDLLSALSLGWNAVSQESDLLVVGEMGIGNTTSAAALATCVFGGDASQWCGRGTGLDDSGVAHKARVVTAGIEKNSDAAKGGLTALGALGGRELAAMVGAIGAARHLRIPVVLDGFIATAAAATLWAENRDALSHVVAGHQSAEGAHAKMLDALGMEPLLSLGLRLGEGSGAALAIQIVKGAIACHSGMATFAEAGVSEG